MTYRLFIDDERFPVTEDDWVIARSSEEAIDCVLTMGFPVHIAFDHDLGGDDTSMKFINWLIDYLLDTKQRLRPDFSFSVHSQNPVGAENIRQLMNAVIKEFG